MSPVATRRKALYFLIFLNFGMLVVVLGTALYVAHLRGVVSDAQAQVAAAQEQVVVAQGQVIKAQSAIVQTRKEIAASQDSAHQACVRGNVLRDVARYVLLDPKFVSDESRAKAAAPELGHQPCDVLYPK